MSTTMRPRDRISELEAEVHALENDLRRERGLTSLFAAIVNALPDTYISSWSTEAEEALRKLRKERGSR